MEPIPSLPTTEPGLATRFVRLFTSPRAAFQAPRSRNFWLVPLIIIAAANAVQSVTLGPLYLEAARERVSEMENLSQEQRDQILEGMEKSSGSGTMIAQTALGTLGAILFSVVVPAALDLAGINFGMGGRATFREVFGVQAFASLISVVREAITLPIKLAQQTISVRTSPAAFLDESDGLFFHVAALFDVFTIFQLFVTAVGLSVVGQIPTRRAGVVVIAFWALWSALAILWRLSPFGAFTP